MKRSRIIFWAVLVAAFAGGGAWYAKQMAPHQHELMQMTNAEGEVYYTCPMHPQVRQDEPGNCPICGMKLAKREEGAAAMADERKPLYWYDPMVPSQRFDAPGKSPFMDMQLVPKYADEGGGGAGVVTIDPRMAQNLGMRTAKVEKIRLAGGLEAAGSVAADERRMQSVVSRVAGFVERLDVRAVGEPVRRGQVIAGVYSPELYAAQQEFLLALKGDGTLAAASRERLKLLGMGEPQIAAVAESGQAQRQALITAPVGGVVSELNAREGGQTEPGMPLMRISDLSRVWVQVEIPEAQASVVRQGLRAEARLAGLPGRIFEGKVDYIYPSVDMAARTLRARLTFDNPGLLLKPGMYASVSLATGGSVERMVVPSAALIRTGKRDVVIVAEGEGRFRPQEVRVGREADGKTEILEGIAEDEEVVVSGQFLIDSEANLQGVLSRLSGATK
ncbi:MAG: efflux RND transporter periplasmic adaptor subunit [Pseudomonadota bacterium]